MVEKEKKDPTQIEIDLEVEISILLRGATECNANGGHAAGRLTALELNSGRRVFRASGAASAHACGLNSIGAHERRSCRSRRQRLKSFASQSDKFLVSGCCSHSSKLGP